MLSLSLALITMDALLLKYGFISWMDSIQASGILATFKLFIDLALKLFFGK